MCRNVDPRLKAKHLLDKHGRAKATAMCYQNYQSYDIASAGYWYWSEVYDHVTCH